MRVDINGPVGQMQVNGDYSAGNVLHPVGTGNAQLASELHRLGIPSAQTEQLDRLLDGSDRLEKRSRILRWCQQTADSLGTGVTVAVLTSVVERHVPWW